MVEVNLQASDLNLFQIEEYLDLGQLKTKDGNKLCSNQLDVLPVEGFVFFWKKLLIFFSSLDLFCVSGATNAIRFWFWISQLVVLIGGVNFAVGLEIQKPKNWE